MAGVSSPASTVPGSTPEARLNAQNGVAEAAVMANENTTPQGSGNQRPSPPLRVNSVPILATPAERIIRRANTSPAEALQSVAADPNPPAPESASASPQLPNDPATPPTSVKKVRKTKNKRLRRAKTIAGAAGEAPTGAVPADRCTAAKSMAKPTIPKDHVVSTKAEPPLPTPVRNAQTMHENMQRANTGIQRTPAQTPEGGERSPSPSFSELLDREVKKEAQHLPEQPDPTAAITPTPPSSAIPAASKSSVPAPPSAITTPPAPAPAPAPAPEGKTGRIKTPAQKAAHARYMRFSRSFQRFLI